MKLNEKQKKQVTKQLLMHNRESGIRTIALDDKTSIDFLIEKGVFGSDFMSSGIYLARFLYNNRKELYTGKYCLDMGCGAGIQGLVMAKYGARFVDFADVSTKAVENTRKNIEMHNLEGDCRAVESDLFSNLKEKYDVIVFNHPFFPEDAENFGEEFCPDLMLRKSMLGGTELLPHFLREVKGHLTKDGIIIMPYFSLAGNENDPWLKMRNYGLDTLWLDRLTSREGIQQGYLYVYVLAEA